MSIDYYSCSSVSGREPSITVVGRSCSLAGREGLPGWPRTGGLPSASAPLANAAVDYAGVADGATSITIASDKIARPIHT
ncbi:MAG: hypothetical protein ACJ8CR_28965 [Roseiflexaceae bacterium]